MNLEDIRREYLQGGLSRQQLADDPMVQFERWMTQAQTSELFADPTAMTVATVAANGQPSLRTVLLKHFDDKGFVFYTNLGSRKAQEIRENNQVCLQFAWLPLERQVMVYGRAEALSVSEVAAYFIRRPKMSQIAAWTSHQSKPISSRQLLEKALLQMKEKFKDGQVPLPDFWGGYRVVPNEIEFWQGGANRLHDRFLYRRQDASWSIERLQP